MNLIALPAFSDNCFWMFHDGRQATVVDPGESAPVLAPLAASHLTLAAILGGSLLVAHHHADHVGGVDALRPHLHGPVDGPKHERIPAPSVPLDDSERIEMLGLHFEAIDVPAHTSGHFAYCAGAPAGTAPLLPCGDALSSGGCGRLFEGTPAQMHASLSRPAELPAATRVCCGHEYTLSNLKFAPAVEPDNRDVATYNAWWETQRAEGHPTLPSSIARERQINPFLRCDVPDVARCARAHGAASDDPATVLAALRQWTNDL